MECWKRPRTGLRRIFRESASGLLMKLQRRSVFIQIRITGSGAEFFTHCCRRPSRDICSCRWECWCAGVQICCRYLRKRSVHRFRTCIWIIRSSWKRQLMSRRSMRFPIIMRSWTAQECCGSWMSWWSQSFLIRRKNELKRFCSVF